MSTAADYEVAQRHPQAGDDGPGDTAHPWKTLRKAGETVKQGDRVIIRSGIYRERVVIKASGTAQAPIVFESAPGEDVVLTGLDRLTGWLRLENPSPIYSVPWPHNFIGWNPHMTHPDDEYHRIVGRCEQVVIDGYPLHQVLAASQMAPGTFFADVANKKLLVWDIGSRDPNRLSTEASRRQELLTVAGDHVRVRGIRFRNAANMAQHGAVALAGNHDVLEDCIVERMNASGAVFSGEDALVRRCVFRDNGQLGFGANRAHRLVFTECVVENNNIKGFDRGWEAGGNKLVLCKDAVLERSQFVRNRGNGVWFDIGNTNCTVRQCLIADNEDAGIFYEISFGLVATDNVIVGNGFASTPGAWGAQAGICLSSSPYCVLERNLIAGNREGFNFREQTRTTPTLTDKREQPVWNHDQRIRENLIVGNRDAQIWGWFDVQDNRHWPNAKVPRDPAAAGSATSGTKPGDLAAAYGAKAGEGQPAELTLEGLNLRFETNVYYAHAGQGWFHWGTTWGQHLLYTNLTDFQKGLGVDTGSRILDPGFADWLRRDFRLSTRQMDELKECYPHGPVPGVQLGVEEPRAERK